jgi:hypothetical protein
VFHSELLGFVALAGASPAVAALAAVSVSLCAAAWADGSAARSARSVGKLDGTVIGAVAGPRPNADATTARNCFKSTGLVR